MAVREVTGEGERVRRRGGERGGEREGDRDGVRERDGGRQSRGESERA